ncbi:MAG: calcium-binding protein, partial [Planctomycetales bacterium]|nr:calcium-binding protein [Planctomycetales bacterium]
MLGFGGNDIYVVANAGTEIVETAGNGDNDRVATSVDFALAADDDIELLTTTATGGTTPLNLTGNALAQTIIGNAGDNTLHTGGGANADVLRGLGGNDTYRVFNAGDTIIEAIGGGNDKVQAAVNYVLTAGAEIETLQTNGSTGTANLDLTGNELDQRIFGNAGANRLDSLFGNDTLTGLLGDDTFVFSTAPGAGNVDLITDFNPADDTIALSLSVFSAITQAPGTLLSGFFKANAAGVATDANDRVVYNTATGGLFFDADGFG